MSSCDRAPLYSVIGDEVYHTMTDSLAPWTWRPVVDIRARIVRNRRIGCLGVITKTAWFQKYPSQDRYDRPQGRHGLRLWGSERGGKSKAKHERREVRRKVLG